MRVYDQRIKYFGDYKKYPEAYILGKKAVDYKSLKRSDMSAQKQSYDWLKQSIDGLGDNATPLFLNHYMALSLSFYAKDEITGEKMITDYELVQEKLEKIAARGGRNGQMAKQMIPSFEQSFANSGAADCNTLEQMYAPRLKANPGDEVLLAKLIDLFDKTECTDSELYYKASEAMHKVNPTAASASGVAKMYLAQDNAAKAVLYYKEAISLEVDDERKAQYLYTIAYISFSKDKNLVVARQLALQAVGANPQWGEPYILIGKMYAQSAQEQKIGTKDIENQAGYWASVDLFNKAKRVDAECATEADQLIKIYSNYFPTKEEIFFDPDYEAGKSVKVGGWIGTSTIVRSRD
jgi:tetratricopeptide (TPR) repeat protein